MSPAMAGSWTGGTATTPTRRSGTVRWSPAPTSPARTRLIDLGEVGLAPEVLGAIPPSALPGFVSIVPTLDAGPPSQEQDHNPASTGTGRGWHRKR